MTKQQLAEALKRAKQLAKEPQMPSGIDAMARAYGYLERAVEEYVGFDKERSEPESVTHRRNHANRFL